MNRTTTIADLLRDYEGASSAEWMQVSYMADSAGRCDLVAFCREQAEVQWAQEDET